MVNSLAATIGSKCLQYLHGTFLANALCTRVHRRKCPIPRAPWAWADTGASFEPVCQESEACSSYHGPKFSGPGCGTNRSSCSTGTFPCQCSGWGVGDLFRLEIVDRIKVPTNLSAGDWVLGWRWDWCDTSSLMFSDSEPVAPARSTALS